MDNKILFKDLQQQINDRQVLCVVGAGVSIATTDKSKNASWKGLLQSGVDWAMQVSQPPPSSKWRDSVIADIESNETDLLISAAEKISSKLGAPKGPEYANWLRDSIGNMKVVDRELIEAIAALNAPIATTNYDSLLEEITGQPAVTARDSSDVERVIRGAQQGIIHLHGWWKHPETTVLGIRSYERVLADAHAQATLHALTMTKTLLFIGFGAGLGDPNFDALATWASKTLAGSSYRRYRLLKEAEALALASIPQKDPRLYTLSYGASHKDLPSFLRALAPEKKPRKKVRKKSPATNASDDKTALTKLLADIHSPNMRLSQCLAEALVLAVKIKSKELEAFCRNELGGWRTGQNGGTIEDQIAYRVMTVFVSLRPNEEINIDAGWRSEGRIFEYMEANPEVFKRLRLAISWPVSELEAEARKPTSTPALLVLTMSAKLLIPSTKYNGNIQAYARSDAISVILARIRTELTKRLLSLLQSQ